MGDVGLVDLAKGENRKAVTPQVRATTSTHLQQGTVASMSTPQRDLWLALAKHRLSQMA